MEVQQREIARLTKASELAAASEGDSEANLSELSFKVECLTSQNSFLNCEIVDLARQHQRITGEMKERLSAMFVNRFARKHPSNHSLCFLLAESFSAAH